MKYVCSVLLSLTAASAAAQPSTGERLSLDTAIQLAVEHNRLLEISRQQVARMEQQLAAARTRRLPSFDTSLTGSGLLRSVDFSFPRGAFGEFDTIGPVPATDTSVTMTRQPTAYVSAQISQPLSQLYQIDLRVRGAALAVDVEKARARDQQLVLVNNVRRLFSQIVQTKTAIDAGQEAVALYRELDRTVATRVAQQVALRADALDVQYRLAQEELSLTSAHNTLASQKEQLNRLLGRDVRTAFDADEAPRMTVVGIDLAAAQARAIAARPDVQEARLKLQQATLDRRLSAADRIPEVSLAVSYSSYFNMDVLPKNLASASIQVKWEPFDWGRKGHELAGKSRAIEQARLGVRDLEDRVALEVSAKFRRLSEARALVRVLETAQASAREKLRVRTNQYQINAAMLTDVLQTRTDLASTVDRYQQALGAFWIARADFDLAIGEEGIR